MMAIFYLVCLGVAAQICREEFNKHGNEEY